MEIIKRRLGLAILLVVSGAVHAQQVIVNTVGKDPFVGKTSEVVYKAKEGTWTFQGYNNAVIKTTYKTFRLQQKRTGIGCGDRQTTCGGHQNNERCFSNRGVG